MKHDETDGGLFKRRDLETASPPAAMTSQNYLQLLHEKSDSFPSNLCSYANTNSSRSAFATSPPNRHEGLLPYINKEETYEDLPALPQKLFIRSKTENPSLHKGLSVVAANNHIEASSEPHVNSDMLLNGTLKGDNMMYKTTAECMDSRRSS